jgi:hypothetical protein
MVHVAYTPARETDEGGSLPPMGGEALTVEIDD